MAVVRVVGGSVLWICLLAGALVASGCSVVAQPGQIVLIRAVPNACTSAAVPTTLTPSEQQEMLTLHNALRAKYGSGALTWDATLASCAQDWAEERARTSDAVVHRPGNTFGENTFSNEGCCDPDEFRSTPAAAMGFWGGEERFYDRTTETCQAGADCSHFTQVVWSATTKIGCGRAFHNTPDGTTTAYWVCNYDAKGNSGGSPSGARTTSATGGVGGGSACPQPGTDGLRCLIDGGRAAAGLPRLALSGSLGAVATALARGEQPGELPAALTAAGYCPSGTITSSGSATFVGSSAQAAFDHFSTQSDVLRLGSGDFGVWSSGNRFALVHATCG
jgi:pathogenesis-related protein 1